MNTYSHDRGLGVIILFPYMAAIQKLIQNNSIFQFLNSEEIIHDQYVLLMTYSSFCLQLKAYFNEREGKKTICLSG